MIKKPLSPKLEGATEWSAIVCGTVLLTLLSEERLRRSSELTSKLC